MAVNIKVNGAVHTVPAEPDTPLLYVLRNDLGLNAAKFGCGLGQCGTCTERPVPEREPPQTDYPGPDSAQRGAARNRIPHRIRRIDPSRHELPRNSRSAPMKSPTP